jgi:hypothetical protein
MMCSTGVTPPVLNLTTMPAGAVWFYRFDSGSAIQNFSTLPIGSAVTVQAFVCVVFDATTTMCSTALATVPPDAGYAKYRTKVNVDACKVGEAPGLSVAGAAADWSAVWTLRDENGDITSDYTAMRTATVTVSFTGDLTGITDWTSDTTTCSGVPEPPVEPSVTPTPSPTP